MKLNSERDQELCRLFPELFKHRHNDDTDSQLIRGFSIGEGWFSVVVDLCKKLEVMASLSGFDITAKSVYQHMGKLRFVYNINDLTVDKRPAEINQMIKYIIADLVWKAEMRSGRICEICGQPGTLEEINEWWSCRCDGCRHEHEEDSKFNRLHYANNSCNNYSQHTPRSRSQNFNRSRRRGDAKY